MEPRGGQQRWHRRAADKALSGTPPPQQACRSSPAEPQDEDAERHVGCGGVGKLHQVPVLRHAAASGLHHAVVPPTHCQSQPCTGTCCNRPQNPTCLCEPAQAWAQHDCTHKCCTAAHHVHHAAACEIHHSHGVGEERGVDGRVFPAVFATARTQKQLQLGQCTAGHCSAAALLPGHPACAHLSMRRADSHPLSDHTQWATSGYTNAEMQLV